MKKAISVLICMMILFSFSACASSKVKFDDFAECKQDFETTSSFLRSYYVENGCSARVVFHFQDGKILRDDAVVSDDYSKETETILDNGFSFVWVEEDYMIFWEDETKYYGVLFSENAKSAIDSVEEWREGIKSKKLDKNWYEIGALDSI